jgi:hypothetical protein
MRMMMGMTASPITAHASCLTRNKYGCCQRSIAITAEALYTITTPVQTSRSVATNRSLSDLSFRAILRRLRLRVPGLPST